MGYNGNSKNNKGFDNRRNSNSEVIVPSAVTVKGFYNTDGTVKPELFDSEAQKIAASWIGKNGDKSIGVTSSQLRRVYDEVKRFELLLVPGSNQWEKQYAYIKLIKSKAAYTLTRAGLKDKSLKGLYANLNTFVASSIDLIKTEADYKVFSSLFEAAYGFYYQMANEKGIKNVDK